MNIFAPMKVGSGLEARTHFCHLSRLRDHPRRTMGSWGSRITTPCTHIPETVASLFIFTHHHNNLGEKAGAWIQIRGIIAKVRAMVQKSQIESSLFFAWDIFCLSCCITGCYGDEGTSWWLHGSCSSLLHCPFEEVDLGTQHLWIGGGLPLCSIRFCDAPRKCLCIVRRIDVTDILSCQWNSESAVS